MKKKDHPLYSTWKSMIARCHVKTHEKFKHYGAKGIIVCERWHDFWCFVEDVDNNLLKGHLLYRKDYQLDKDIKGGNNYSLENCSVITAKKNRNLRNEKIKRSIVAIDDNGKKQRFDSITKASNKLGINRSTINACLKNGWRNNSGYRFKYF